VPDHEALAIKLTRLAEIDPKSAEHETITEAVARQVAAAIMAADAELLERSDQIAITF